MSQPSGMSTLYKTGVAVGIGTVFGVALEKSKVFLPDVIRAQMVFSAYPMLKVFLAATATGMAGMAILEYLGLSERTTKTSVLGLGKMRGYGGNVVGGVIMGCGIALSGACPGTAVAQLGAGIPSAKYTILGGFLGAMTFGVLHKWLTEKGTTFGKKRDSHSIDRRLNRPFWVVTALIAGVVGIGLYALERALPWEQEIGRLFPTFSSSASLLSEVAWPPIMSGIVIGLLQLPSLTILGQALGASGSYVTSVATASKVVDPSHSYIPVFREYTVNYTQFASVVGIFLGATLSQRSSGVLYSINSSISPVVYVLGGFLMILGARIAGGCASGHGISGMARLSVPSVITVAGMFAGGIATAFLGVV